MIELTTAETELADEACCAPGPAPRIAGEQLKTIVADLTLLGHPIRLQILDMLAQSDGRICVCDLETALPVKQPTVSHHLRLLRDAGLIDCERQGLWAYYFLRRDAMAALRARVTGQLDPLS